MRNITGSVLSLIGFAGIAASTWAALQQDVRTFTGNVHAKMVWVRNEDGSQTDGLYNHECVTKLMCYDSDEPAERALDNTVGCHNLPFITRSGDYAIWGNEGEGNTYIVKWDGTGKSVLLTNLQAFSCQWDEATSKEYIYACEQEATTDPWPYLNARTMYRIELKNGVADVANKSLRVDINNANWQSKLNDNGEGKYFRAMPGLVSGDGKYWAVNQPWADVWVDDLTTLYAGYQIPTGGGMSCWPQMAPDKSYRFFHLDENHQSFHMYDTYTTPVANARWIRVNTSLPGNTGQDLAAPRWSNNIKFFSAGYPLTGSQAYAKFCIGKFNDAFTSITGLQITNGGATTRDKVGDLWLANGEGPNKGTGSVLGAGAQPGVSSIDVVTSSAAISVSLPGSGPVNAALVNAIGQPVAVHAGIGVHDWNIATGAMKPGTYFLRVASGGRYLTRKVVVCN